MVLYFWPKQEESIDLENSVSRSEMHDRKVKPQEFILIFVKKHSKDKDYIMQLLARGI